MSVRKALAIVLGVLALGFIITLWPTHTTYGAPVVLPTPTVTLPACIHEDGSGQALCTWDASEQGNGVGTDAVAGDCSVGTVGDMDTSAWCMRLWDKDNGNEYVDDCLTIAFEASQNGAMRIELKNDGWNLAECFKAHV